MMVEALLIAFPFAAGVAVSGHSRWRALGTTVTLEAFALLITITMVKQPPLAAAVTTILLSSASFGGGLMLGRRKPRFRFGGVAAAALVGGALCTAMLARALEAPLRQESVRTTKKVKATSSAAWSAVESAGAFASSSVLGLRLGVMSPAECRLVTTGLAMQSCELGEGRLEQQVTAAESPFHLQVRISERDLTRPLFRFTGAEYFLSSEDGITSVMRTTDYESKLAPRWLWRPLERQLIVAEHRAALESLSGEFVPVAEGGVTVRLSVTTSPPTRVTVVPLASTGRPPMMIGRTPIREWYGAQVGDTVFLDDEVSGIHYEEVIEYGEPGGLKMITKVFRESR